MHHARLALHCLTASLLTLPAAQASAALAGGASACCTTPPWASYTV